MRIAIVTTTINIPVLLRAYAENACYYGHSDVDFIVIGDRKSPPETADFCQTIPHYPCHYLDIPAQKDYLGRFPDLWTHLRFDSIQRRNIGILLAYQRGAEVVITIDDDNFVMQQDFVGIHGAVGSVREMNSLGSTSGWFDVCSFFDVDDGVRFYHRGYPWKMRWTEQSHFVASSRLTRRIAVNAGLWLDNPDIDALTRMDRQPVVRGLHLPNGENFALHRGTWSPFNSQNTALLREAIPAYFLSPYIGRYDDIWASYIISRIADHMNDAIVFGSPVVRQDRNPHNLWKDLDVERNGMIMTDDFCAALRSIPLTGKTYHDCFGELIHGLTTTWAEGPEWTDSQKEWRSRLLEGMSIWHSVFHAASASA
jgi:Reversibly glycosylated polypeptide